MRDPFGLLFAGCTLGDWKYTRREVVAGHLLRAAMRAAVHRLLAKTFRDALLKNDNVAAPIATLVLNCVKNGLNCAQKEDDFAGRRKKFRELPSLTPTVDPSDDVNITSKGKIDAYVVKKRTWRIHARLQGLHKMTTEKHDQVVGPKRLVFSRIRQAQRNERSN